MNQTLKEGAKETVNRYHKGCFWIMTNETWSWKLKSSKECVTTHRSNPKAPKMEGAKTVHRYSTIRKIQIFSN